MSGNWMETSAHKLQWFTCWSHRKGKQKVFFSSLKILTALIQLQPIDGIFATLEKESSKKVYFVEEIFIQNLNKNCDSDLHYTSITNPVRADREGNGYFVPSLPHRRLSAGDITKSLPQLCFAVKHYIGNVWFVHPTPKLCSSCIFSRSCTALMASSKRTPTTSAVTGHSCSTRASTASSRLSSQRAIQCERIQRSQSHWPVSFSSQWSQSSRSCRASSCTF